MSLLVNEDPDDYQEDQSEYGSDEDTISEQKGGVGKVLAMMYQHMFRMTDRQTKFENQLMSTEDTK